MTESGAAAMRRPTARSRPRNVLRPLRQGWPVVAFVVLVAVVAKGLDRLLELLP